jgi:hypothetical protein
MVQADLTRVQLTWTTVGDPWTTAWVRPPRSRSFWTSVGPCPARMQKPPESAQLVPTSAQLVPTSAQLVWTMVQLVPASAQSVAAVLPGIGRDLAFRLKTEPDQEGYAVPGSWDRVYALQ